MSETKRIADCNSWALRKAARRVTQAYDEVMASSGVRSTQFAVLALIAERPGLSINDLAGLMVMDRTTTGKNLRPLERDGLISIVAAPDDRRSRRVNLTKRGLNPAAVRARPWQGIRVEPTQTARSGIGAPKRPGIKLNDAIVPL